MDSTTTRRPSGPPYESSGANVTAASPSGFSSHRMSSWHSAPEGTDREHRTRQSLPALPRNHNPPLSATIPQSQPPVLRLLKSNVPIAPILCCTSLHEVILGNNSPLQRQQLNNFIHWAHDERNPIADPKSQHVVEVRRVDMSGRPDYTSENRGTVRYFGIVNASHVNAEAHENAESLQQVLPQDHASPQPPCSQPQQIPFAFPTTEQDPAIGQRPHDLRLQRSPFPQADPSLPPLSFRPHPTSTEIGLSRSLASTMQQLSITGLHCPFHSNWYEIRLLHSVNADPSGDSKLDGARAVAVSADLCKTIIEKCIVSDADEGNFRVVGTATAADSERAVVAAIDSGKGAVFEPPTNSERTALVNSNDSDTTPDSETRLRSWTTMLASGAAWIWGFLLGRQPAAEDPTSVVSGQPGAAD